MASTTFTDGQSIIYSAWLNDVNNGIYNGNFAASTLSPTNIVCNGSVSGTGFTSLVNNVFSAPGPIGTATPSTGAFTTLSASSLTLTTPLAVGQGGTGANTLTANSLLVGNGTSAVSAGIAPTAVGNIPFSTDGSTFTSVAKIFRATAQASTSGTAITFGSIPSWVKRVTVMFFNTSTSGTSNVQVRLGTSSGIDSSSYLGIVSETQVGGGVNATTWSGTGADVTRATPAANTFAGQVVFTNISGNLWVISGSVGYTNSNYQSTGSKTLSSALTQLQITTVNGTDTFDAGSINILYE